MVDIKKLTFCNYSYALVVYFEIIKTYDYKNGTVCIYVNCNALSATQLTMTPDTQPVAS